VKTGVYTSDLLKGCQYVVYDINYKVDGIVNKLNINDLDLSFDEEIDLHEAYRKFLPNEAMDKDVIREMERRTSDVPALMISYAIALRLTVEHIISTKNLTDVESTDTITFYNTIMHLVWRNGCGMTGTLNIAKTAAQEHNNSKVIEDTLIEIFAMLEQLYYNKASMKEYSNSNKQIMMKATANSSEIGKHITKFTRLFIQTIEKVDVKNYTLAIRQDLNKMTLNLHDVTHPRM